MHEAANGQVLYLAALDPSTYFEGPPLAVSRRSMEQR